MISRTARTVMPPAAFSELVGVMIEQTAYLLIGHATNPINEMGGAPSEMQLTEINEGDMSAESPVHRR